jgi:LuxR family transcriptional regulator, maltose regulon positive regulatory protein
MSSEQSAELLRTKLTPPRLPDSLVNRDALLARLSAGLDRKLALVSAPAGSGKTTLISQWSASLPVGWLALDAGDNDPVRFWRYVIAACQTFAPSVGTTALARLNQPQPPSYETLLTSLVNDLAGLERQSVLVLEDYHCITVSVIHDAMAFLLDHLPPTLHLVIITRGDCPLPLARLRVRGELHELAAADLRFSESEITTFFENTLAMSLPSDAVAQFMAQTEGWAAALRLAALAAQNQRSPQAVAAFLATFSGTHRHIADYLAQEVLATQSAPVQGFLLQTSFLTRLRGDLCDAVTGRDNSAETLENLSRANVFITPVDGEGRWYRYHALFAEAMQIEAQRRFGESAWLALHHRAADWYEQQGFHAEAVEIALTTNDHERAARLMLADGQSEPYRIYREFHTLRRWLDQLPDTVLREYPALCFTHAMSILFTGDRRNPATAILVEKALEMAAAQWQAADDAANELGRVFALRGMMAWWQGDFEQAFIAARHAQELLADDDDEWRGVILLQIAYAEVLEGRLSAAEETLMRARRANMQTENPHGALAVEHLQAGVCLQRGELRQAQIIYQQILEETGTNPEFSDDRGHALAALAAIHYEWNDLARAEKQAAEAVIIARKLNAGEILTPAIQALARIQHARGEVSQAQQLLRTALSDIDVPLLAQEIQLTQMQLALAAGEIEVAQRWHAQHVDTAHTFRPHVLLEREALVTARLLIALDELDAARKLLNQWQADARAAGRIRSEIEIVILQALAYARQGSDVQACRLLERALVLAHSEEYQRLFVDEGDRLAELLRGTVPIFGEQPHAAYARILLLAFAEEQACQRANTSSETVTPIKPLSDQERRVLRLLAAGLSNPEIADQLVVSVNTIKTQVRSIYDKLSVSSREQAAEVALRLKL